MDIKKLLESSKDFETHKIITDPIVLGKSIKSLDNTPYEVYDKYGVEHRIIVAADEFVKDPDSDFDADYNAEKYLSAKGYSVGKMQAASPRGLAHGNYRIEKWRNLSDTDKNTLDGILVKYRDRIVAYFFNMPE